MKRGNLNIFERKVLSQLPIIFLFFFENIELTVSLKTDQLHHTGLNIAQ